MLTIFTLNTWCPPYSQHRTARARAISKEILRLSPDVACLQEMFLHQPRKIVCEALRAAYPYQHYFDAGWIGSGLLIVSRLPIQRLGFERFRLGGKPEDLKHGDYYAGKGIGVVRVRVNGVDVDIYNTHTHAQYEPNNDNEYAFYNLSNLWQAAKFIRRWSGSTRHILAGDLNTRPDQLGYRVMREALGLRDAFAECHPQEDGYTYRTENPYAQAHNQRLDYVLYSHGLAPRACSIAYSDIPVNGALALSDHDALLAQFDITSEPAPASQAAPHDLKSASVSLAIREMKLTDHQELTHIERVFGIALLSLDVHRQAGLLKWLPPRMVRRLRAMVIFFALLGGITHLLQLIYGLPSRRKSIAAALDDITEMA